MSDRAFDLYKRKLDFLINKRRKDDAEQDQADYDAYMKRQENMGKLNTAFSLYNNITKARMAAPTLKLQETYGEDATAKKYETTEGGEFGPLNPLRLFPGGEDFEPGQYFEERGVKGFGEEIGKSMKKFARPVKETEGYKEFKADKEASELSLKESREQARDIVPVAEEFAVDEPIAYDRLGQTEDVWTPVPAPATTPDYEEIQRQADLYTPTVPAPPDYEAIEAAAQEAQLQRLEEKQLAAEELEANRKLTEQQLKVRREKDRGITHSKIAPADRDLVGADVLTEEEMGGLQYDPTVEDFVPSGIDPTKGLPKADGVVTVPMAIGGEGGAPQIPDAKPGFMSKGFGAVKKLGTMENMQNAYSLWNIGQTIGDKDTTGRERGVATVKATKLLADLSAKQAGQKTAVEAVKAGTKIGGKAAVGAAAGGVLGGYTMVTEGKAAGESWEEKDYDEAILHGMGSVSGGLQTAGAGMMLSGVGAPLGAILYGVGTAGSVISSVGGFIEGLFDKEEEVEVEQPKKSKVNLRRYYRGIMDRDPRSDYSRYGR